MTDLIERLRNTPNWQRESFEHWKTATSIYDRAPFEAADEIERLRAELKALQDPTEDAAAFRLRFPGAVATIEADMRERCASICNGIGATYTGEARRLEGQHATHAAGRRDGANECAAAIREQTP